jgi:hypothetical protein
VAFCQQAAKNRLPKSVYAALLAASEKGVTVAENVDAYAELGLCYWTAASGAAVTLSRRWRSGRVL